MKIDSVLLSRLVTVRLGENPPPDVARAFEGFNTQLSGIAEILRGVSSVNQAKAGEVARHLEVMDKLHLDLGELQSRCGHDLTTFYPDPSGGNDSFTECDICGLQSRAAILN